MPLQQGHAAGCVVYARVVVASGGLFRPGGAGSAGLSRVAGRAGGPMNVEVRPEEGQTTSSGASRWPTRWFGRRYSQLRSNFGATRLD